MKIVHTVSLLILSIFLYAKQNPLSKILNYELSQLIGSWTFESMTTITKGKREEITIVYKDKNNVETLSFELSGSISYNVINDGIEKNGSGLWYAEHDHITIIVESDTTYGTYQIEDSTLIIITSTEESNEFYGYSTIIKYNSR